MRTFVLMIFIWLICSLFWELNRLYVPDLFGTLEALFAEAKTGSLFINIGATFTRVFFGLFVGAFTGTCLGFAMGFSKPVRAWFMPAVEFLRSIPTSMLFPVFIVTLGVGELSKFGIVAIATFPIMAVSVFIGTQPREDSKDRRDYLHIHANRLSRKIRIFSAFYDALPSVVSGFKLSISIALVLTIVTEMFFVASSGVGWAAYQAYQAFEIDMMYLYIVVVGTAGLMLNAAFDKVLKVSNQANH